MLIGLVFVAVAVMLWLVAKSIGPTVKDGLTHIAWWAICMAVLASPAGTAMQDAFDTHLSETSSSAITTVAVVAFLAAIFVGWRRFRDQKAAVAKMLPEPPKTSFKRRLDRGL